MRENIATEMNNKIDRIYRLKESNNKVLALREMNKKMSKTKNRL
jgi:hypothetical protein